LPNGLHDALIRSLDHNYEKAVVSLQVEILFLLPDDPPKLMRYRNGVIQFHQTIFCTVELPENERIFGHPGSIWFKFWRIEPGILAKDI